jgi:gas vesicle structural protein
MARRKKPPSSGEWPFPNLVTADGDDSSSLLDVVDTVLNKGAVLSGDIVLGVANVDLIYAKLSVLLAALDKIERRPSRGLRRSTRRKPASRKPAKGRKRSARR